jgi:hypothetical protein
MKKLSVFVFMASFFMCGCNQTIPKEALRLSPESLSDRQMQTRKFDTKDEKFLLSASAAVMQDLGFTISESETKLGVIVAKKNRDQQRLSNDREFRISDTCRVRRYNI